MKLFVKLESRQKEVAKKLKLRRILNVAEVMDFEEVAYINKVATFLDWTKYIKANGKEKIRNFTLTNATLKPIKANKVEIFYGVNENSSQVDPQGLGQLDQEEGRVH